MRPSKNRQLVEALLPDVLAAARCQMQHFHPGVVVDRKADFSPVTPADHESELIILEALHRVAPGVPVVAEEASAAGHRVAVGDYFFLVDPLDGTRQFIRQDPEFAINIGLISHGRPVFGLIYAPALGELFVTTDDGIAYEARVKPDDVRSFASLELTPLRVRTPDLNALTVLHSASLDVSRKAQVLSDFGIASWRCVGSSLKFGMIARGEADAYVRIGETSEWDTAAGHAILVAAGGIVTDLDGHELTYGHCRRDYVNPYFIASGQELVASAVSLSK